MNLPPELIALGLTARAVADCPASDLAACLNAGFTGYLVPLHLDASVAARRFAAEGLDPVVSRLLFGPTGEPAGLLLLDRRGWQSRIAAMALAPDWRSRGLGRPLLEMALAEARARGDRSLCLEVFAQNEPAVRLYRALGFAVVRELVGYELPAPAAPRLTPDTVTEVDPLTVARVVMQVGTPDLPWQLTGATLAATIPPWRAYELGGVAWAVVQDAAPDKCLLRSLIVHPAARRQGWGRRLLAALTAAHPGRSWFLPPVAPAEITIPFFDALGWQRHTPLYQYEMRIELNVPM